MGRKLKVGFDFDGVVAYNPLRIFRQPVASFKNIFFKKKETSFFVPKTSWQKWIWTILHETSVFPSYGIEKLKEMVQNGEIEAYIVTGRYSFLEESFYRWLKKHGLEKTFKGYYLNKANEQPHLFKERMLKKLGLDIFVEDNWDIVQHLSSKNKIRIHWIYNLLDHFKKYENKHASLQDFLKRLKLD